MARPDLPKMSLITDRQLDLGVFQQFLRALLFPGPFLGQGAPVAGQVPQLALRAGRDERGPEHAALGELAQPDRIELVRFGPAGDVLDVAGVDHPALDVVFEQVERRLPVRRGGLHHHQGHALADQPVPQFQQRRGQRGVGADLLAARPGLALMRHPHAHRQRRLPDVQRRDPFHQRARFFCDLVHDHDPSCEQFPGGLPAGARRGFRGGIACSRQQCRTPVGRLPAPDSYAGSTAPSITGFGGHPTRFSRFRASPRDTDDSYVCQGVRMTFSVVCSSGVREGGLTGVLLGCGQDRDGPLRVERQALIRSRPAGSGGPGDGRRIVSRPARIAAAD